MEARLQSAVSTSSSASQTGGERGRLCLEGDICLGGHLCIKVGAGAVPGAAAAQCHGAKPWRRRWRSEGTLLCQGLGSAPEHQVMLETGLIEPGLNLTSCGVGPCSAD